MAEEEKVFTSLEDPQWYNKTRVLIVSSKGITAAQRQFILGIFALLPHSKKDFKIEKQDVHEQIQELCETHKTRYFLYFESRKKIRFSMWIGRYPEGPSIKFDIDGIVHVRDVKFQGNAVKGARHILSFDEGMQSDPKMKVAKELFIGAFNVPKYHPKSTAVIDHTLNFIKTGDEISFRNYQVFREFIGKDKQKIDLFEIGPRFIMRMECILEGVICGEVLYRSSIVRKYLKKGKQDKRKLIEPEEIQPMNVFGQQL